MRTQLLVRTALATALAALSATALAAPPEGAPAPARVMMFGMFHFANPGRDMVKSGVVDVTTPAHQAYLDGLAGRLAGFEPTAVLAECSPGDQARYDAQFEEYVAGDFDLPTNETYQIGFRLAQQAGLSGVTCFDEDQVGWDAQPMFDYMDAHDTRAREDIEARFKALSAEQDREQSSLSLAQLLQLASDPGRDAVNKGLYLRTNAVGAGDGFAGADASASWWHRNFRMYANIQKAAGPGDRVVVLAGQGHTAILKDLLAVDDRRVAEDVRPYLEAGD
ncbi:DUF5694 domain-containing protein [Marilutibacter spongiae]|uniref:ChaN family lipoprotein n=1 Tax=Marilutibacter spongiae TaxID=2025720 RepID=A0A7W3TJU6_9GAMM|nr:DUF5694 domain-containing protein [Lysobacter spongiae]MBB1059556.1 hypothetical protein [Lysobacter spongiae]